MIHISFYLPLEFHLQAHSTWWEGGPSWSQASSIKLHPATSWTSPVAQKVKNPSAMQEAQEMQVWSLGQEGPLEKGMANPPQYSCLENPMDRGAWQAIIVHGIVRVGHNLEAEPPTRVTYVHGLKAH